MCVIVRDRERYFRLCGGGRGTCVVRGTYSCDSHKRREKKKKEEKRKEVRADTSSNSNNS
jgi:hypothetical protein